LLVSLDIPQPGLLLGYVFTGLDEIAIGFVGGVRYYTEGRSEVGNPDLLSEACSN
jgi:hypothetical protein